MLKRRYSKKRDGNAKKKKIIQKGGRKCYKEEDIPIRGTEMLKRRRYSKKGDGKAKKKKIIQKRGTEMLQRRRHSKNGDRNATKKKIFQKGRRKCYKEEDIPERGT